MTQSTSMSRKVKGASMMSGETTPLMEEHWFADDGVVPNNPRLPLVVYRGVLESVDGPTISYGKGALVGVDGEMEHGGACVHPMLSKPMRAAIGGGKAVISSNVTVAAAGASLDVPLGHKDDSWSFPHFDTITVAVADAPRPNEILVVMAIADGGRLRNRCGTEPIR